MIEDPVIKSWAIAAQSTQAVLFHVPTENMRRIFRYIEALTAERDRLREALTDALDAWDTHNKHGDPMQGWWVHDAQAALKGETP